MTDLPVTTELENVLRRAEVAEQLAEELVKQRDSLQAQVIALTETVRSRGGPMTDEEIMELATFNSERSRGVVHTPGYVLQMSALQARFDSDRRQQLIDEGWVEVEPESNMWVKAVDRENLDLS